MQQVEIEVKGQIDPERSKWLGSLSVGHTGAGQSVLTGQMRDQSALFGLLERLSSLGLRLASVDVKDATPLADEEVRRM
jgi:hypothetical protein